MLIIIDSDTDYDQDCVVHYLYSVNKLIMHTRILICSFNIFLYTVMGKITVILMMGDMENSKLTLFAQYVHWMT